MNEPSFPFRRGIEADLGALRDFSARLSAYRQSDQLFSQQLRENRRPWAKTWNEELVPLMNLVNALALPSSDRFRLMPNGHEVDLELIAGGERQGVQVTVADLVWLEASYQSGHLRALKMECMAGGSVYGGARLRREGGKLISEPHARGLEEDVEACKAGLIAALERKRTHDGRGKTLLVFARDFTQHLYDVDTDAMIAAAVAPVPAITFDELYIVDSGIFWRRLSYRPELGCICDRFRHPTAERA